MPIRWSAVGRRLRIESTRLYEHLPYPHPRERRSGRRVLILNMVPSLRGGVVRQPMKSNLKKTSGVVGRELFV